ncbi:MAG: tetratricopeptide repeat protein [Cyanobacteria bacterium NC_groundwater_1444_Ag_S-0.65um_54_12]|nr:tetratricopeptide repeat protein [Cyanobacteria bacterium NC_groundwater_1444_Ag_S-0.65um_54_12]
MLHTVVQRKLELPVLPRHHLARPLLLQRLETGLRPDKRLTLVLGGPGSGKTALLAEYAIAHANSVFWYSLSPSDSDPVGFFSHLAEGLRSRYRELSSEGIGLVTALGRRGLTQAIGLLCDEWQAVIEEPFILILDGVEYLAASKELAEALNVLVNLFPERSQLVFSGRTLPALKLAQYKLRDQLTSIEDEDLRLSCQEIEQLLCNSLKQAIAPEVVEQLLDRTGGWVTGVVYAASGETADLVTRLEQPEVLYEFLAEEILSHFAPEFLQKLLACAYLPRLEVRTCRKLLGAEADAFLAALDSQRFLVTRFDDGLAFHPIFRDFLQRTALARWPRQIREEVFHRLARDVAVTPEDAVTFLQLANDWEQAQERLVRAANTFFRESRLTTLQSLLAAFPPSFLRESAWLCYLAGEILRREGRLSASLGKLLEAERLALAGNNQEGLGRILASLAAVAGARGDTAHQLDYAQRALTCLPPGSSDAVASCHNVLATYYLYRHDAAQAEPLFKKALALYQDLGDASGEMRVYHNLGLLHASTGDFDRAVSCYGESLRQSEPAGILPLPMTYNNLALCYFHLGKSAQAYKVLEKGMSLVERLAAKRDRLFLLRTLGQLALYQGDYAKSEEAFEASHAEATAIGDILSQANAAIRIAELRIRQQDYKSAQLAIERAIAISGRTLADPEISEAALLQVEIELATGQLSVAQERLNSLTNQMKAAPNHHQAFHVARLWKAWYLANQQEQQAVLQSQIMRDLARRFGYPLDGSEVSSEQVSPTPPEPTISVRCLGAFAVSVDGEQIPSRAWKVANAKLTLAYLLLRPQGATREALTEFLYPREDTTPAAIHAVIARLRQALEPASRAKASCRFIIFQDGRYLFNRGVHLAFDVADFRRLVYLARQPGRSEAERSELLERATKLYSGHFLEDCTDNDWCQLERENLRRLAGEVFEERCALAAARDDWLKLEQLADNYLSLDPGSELACRAKMVSLFMQDRAEDALRIGQLALDTLQKRSGLEPEEETSELFELLQTGKLTVRIAKKLVTSRCNV